MIPCAWCRRARSTTRGRFCSQRCRQAAFRLRRRGDGEGGADDEARRFAYADPPYPGTAARYYAHEPEYAGEVDHAQLVASLVDGGYAGWALSTSARALRDVLPLCPSNARVAAWVKPHGASPLTYGLHNCWEPVIVVPGRQRRPGRRDWLSALPARGGGELPGRKPLAFCAWLFGLLGMLPGDELVDVFPGTGIVSASWRELSRGIVGHQFDFGAGRYVPLVADGDRHRVAAAPGDASLVHPGDASLVDVVTSPLQKHDAAV